MSDVPLQRIKYRLCFRWNDGNKDNIVIEADTIEEIREIANNERKKRNPDIYWSEKL